MKKIFALWIMVAALLMFVNVTAGAEEAVLDVDASETVTETVSEETEGVVESVGTEIYNTLFNRIFDFMEMHKETIIMVSGFVGSILLALVEGHRKKKADSDMGNKQAEILSDILGVTSSQNGVIGVVNELSAGYAEMKEK